MNRYGLICNLAALLYTNQLDTEYLFVTGGADVRITGLRIQGAEPTRCGGCLGRAAAARKTATTASAIVPRSLCVTTTELIGNLLIGNLIPRRRLQMAMGVRG